MLGGQWLEIVDRELWGGAVKESGTRNLYYTSPKTHYIPTLHILALPIRLDAHSPSPSLVGCDARSQYSKSSQYWSEGTLNTRMDPTDSFCGRYVRRITAVRRGKRALLLPTEE
ncbi:hypothetical protein FRB95_003457 [Tulasnella sp. JGI-2019a]|nr:hypothetical protein FRB95_003457 [Tulasnella sp. JGI-2019a]